MRLEFGLVVGDFGQRHLGLDHQLATACRIGAVDARALAGQSAGHVTHVFLGHVHVEVDDGFEQQRARLADRVEEGLLAGGDEGDFLGIDRYGYLPSSRPRAHPASG
jgi:hypothetical protein